MAKRNSKKNSLRLIILLIILVLIIAILCFFGDIKKLYNDKSESTVIDKNDNNIKENDKNEEQIGGKNSQKDNNSIEYTKDEKTDEELLEIKKDPNQQQQHETSNKVEVDIKLNGDRRITLKLNEKYVEYGAKAYDSDGNDISNNITIDNSVDTSKRGTYLVIYYIGNSTAVRTVVVE